jgi:DNA-binding transcriptional MerR regulator
MKANDPAISTGYRIGAVSKLTGISPDTLRIWERRYAVVAPQRSPSGGRLYASEDIARLRLIKLLVDRGDSIGSVATLNYDELQARVTEGQPLAALSTPVAHCRLMVIGEPLAAKMNAARDSLPDITLVAAYSTPEAFEAAANEIEADVLLIDQPTLQGETAVRLVDWISRATASHAIVVYRFAAQDTLARLPRSRCSTLRAPVDPLTIRSHCMALLGRHATPSFPDSEHALLTGEAALPRRFNDQALARLATLSSAVKCECPRHLAELITSLSAFEKYSTECESRSPKDAALHAYLNATASRARDMIETALTQVIEAENIQL